MIRRQWAERVPKIRAARPRKTRKDKGTGMTPVELRARKTELQREYRKAEAAS